MDLDKKAQILPLELICLVALGFFLGYCIGYAEGRPQNIDQMELNKIEEKVQAKQCDPLDTSHAQGEARARKEDWTLVHFSWCISSNETNIYPDPFIISSGYSGDHEDYAKKRKVEILSYELIIGNTYHVMTNIENRMLHGFKYFFQDYEVELNYTHTKEDSDRFIAECYASRQGGS